MLKFIENELCLTNKEMKSAIEDPNISYMR